MIVARIDRDYINQQEAKDPHSPISSRVGLEWDHESLTQQLESLIEFAPKVRFRTKDDDGVIYYGGWLLNDDQGEVQYLVQRWTERDAGCTTIEVKLTDGKWHQEIG